MDQRKSTVQASLVANIFRRGGRTWSWSVVPFLLTLWRYEPPSWKHCLRRTIRNNGPEKKYSTGKLSCKYILPWRKDMVFIGGAVLADVYEGMSRHLGNTVCAEQSVIMDQRKSTVQASLVANIFRRGGRTWSSSVVPFLQTSRRYEPPSWKHCLRRIIRNNGPEERYSTGKRSRKYIPPWRKDMVFIGGAVLADVMKVWAAILETLFAQNNPE